jgi:hypothetical protein
MSELADISKAARWDPLIQQGSTFERVLNFGDVPTAGFSFRGQIRRSHQDPDVLASYSFVDLGADDSGHHRIRVLLTPAQTEALPEGRLAHDIEAYTEDDAVVVRLLEGRPTITPEVTRP